MLTIGLPILVVAFLVVTILTYKKCKPDKLLVRFGLGGTKIFNSGGVVVIPIFQSYEYMPLAPMNLDIDLDGDSGVLTLEKIKLVLKADATISISSNPEERYVAASLLMSKNPEDIRNLAKEMLIGTTRMIVANMSLESLLKDRNELLEKVKVDAEAALSKFGLDLKNFNLKQVSDLDGITDLLGRKASAEAKTNAEIATAEMVKKSAVATTEANTTRDTEVAEKEKIKGITISKIASDEAQESAKYNLEKIRAEQNLAADSAGSVYDSERRQNISKIESEKNIVIAESEAQKERATVLEKNKQEIANMQRETIIKETEVEKSQRYKSDVVPKEIEVQIDIIAKKRDLEKMKLEAEMEKNIAAIKAEAIIVAAEADKKSKLLKAEGDAALIAIPILEKARAEQEALKIYGTEGMLNLKLIEHIPEVVKHQVEALKGIKIDSINIISNGNDQDSTPGSAGNEIAQTAQNILKSVPMIKMVNDFYGRLGLTLNPEVANCSGANDEQNNILKPMGNKNQNIDATIIKSDTKEIKKS